MFLETNMNWLSDWIVRKKEEKDNNNIFSN